MGATQNRPPRAQRLAGSAFIVNLGRGTEAVSMQVPAEEGEGKEVEVALTLAGAGNPNVMAGSRDTVGRVKGARVVSCSRSRWPRSTCHREQARSQCSSGLAHPSAPVLPRGPSRPYLRA